MTEVFLCSLMDGTRADWLRECSNYWLAERDVKLIVLSPRNILCNEKDFQSRRRLFADITSASDIYVVADDDCVPSGYVVERAVDILRRHSDFRILSLLPSNCSINPWTPPQEENYTPHEDAEVIEHVDVGGVRFCRKNLLRHWPEQTRRVYDREQCEQIRKEGGRVGYFRDLGMEHLGEGKSSVWHR